MLPGKADLGQFITFHYSSIIYSAGNGNFSRNQNFIMFPL